MIFFRPLPSLPQIPQFIIDEAYDILQRPFVNDTTVHHRMMAGYQDRTLIQHDQAYRSARSRRQQFSETSQQWIRDNIAPVYREFSISVTDYSAPSLGPHVDINASFRFMYVLEPGGHNVETVWWQEPPHDLIREPGYYVCDYNTLTEHSRVCLPPRAWHIIDTRCLHSVENLTGDRIVIHIGFDHDPDIQRLLEQ